MTTTPDPKPSTPQRFTIRVRRGFTHLLTTLTSSEGLPRTPDAHWFDLFPSLKSRIHREDVCMAIRYLIENSEES